MIQLVIETNPSNSVLSIVCVVYDAHNIVRIVCIAVNYLTEVPVISVCLKLWWFEEPRESVEPSQTVMINFRNLESRRTCLQIQFHKNSCSSNVLYWMFLFPLFSQSRQPIKKAFHIISSGFSQQWNGFVWKCQSICENLSAARNFEQIRSQNAGIRLSAEK